MSTLKLSKFSVMFKIKYKLPVNLCGQALITKAEKNSGKDRTQVHKEGRKKERQKVRKRKQKRKRKEHEKEEKKQGRKRESKEGRKVRRNE